MAWIDVDYRNMLRKADQLESLARDLQNISSRDLQNVQSGVNQCWQGSASELYKKKLRTFSRQVDSHARTLLDLAGNLRRAAERYERLERIGNSIFGG